MPKRKERYDGDGSLYRKKLHGRPKRQRETPPGALPCFHKRAYTALRQAWGACQASLDNWGIKQTPYECPHCGLYHTTTRRPAK